MPWNDSRRLVLAALGAASVLAAACTEVRYRRDGEESAESSPFTRTVTYAVERAFYDDPPRCAIVMPLRTGIRDPEVTRAIETAIARHVATRLDRVVDPLARDGEARRRGLDLEREADLRRFAHVMRCDTLIEGVTTEADTTYALVWARRRFGLSVRLSRVGDGRVLWRASHTDSRSDGGLPLSIIGVPINGFSASRLVADQDVLPSMVDDVVRRVVASLPDTRVVR